MCVNYSFQRKRAFTKRTALGLLLCFLTMQYTNVRYPWYPL